MPSVEYQTEDMVHGPASMGIGARCLIHDRAAPTRGYGPPNCYEAPDRRSPSLSNACVKQCTGALTMPAPI